MKRAIRLIMLVAALGQIIFAIGFFTQAPWIQTFWPFDYTERLSFIFMSSIAGAAAGSTLWCLYTREDAAFAGIGLDYVFIFAPLAVFSWQKYRVFPNRDLILLIVAGVLGVIFGIALFLWCRRTPFHQTNRTPRPILITYAVFIIALFFLGGMLISRTGSVTPWTLTADASIIYGWFFVGAAIFFIYGLWKPIWGNAGGQLAGLLVYDLILVIPFLLHFSKVKPNLLINLIIYTIVLSVSGAMAVYYLFIRPDTKLRWWSSESSGAVQMSQERAL